EESCRQGRRCQKQNRGLRSRSRKKETRQEGVVVARAAVRPTPPRRPPTTRDYPATQNGVRRGKTAVWLTSPRPLLSEGQTAASRGAADFEAVGWAEPQPA